MAATDENMAMGNLLWSDLYYHIKVAQGYILCVQNYVNKMRKRKRYADIGMVIVLLFAAVLCKFFAEYAWLIVLVPLIVDFLKDFTPKVIQPETELAKLDSIQATLLSIRNNLESAVLDFINLSEVTDIQIQGKLNVEKKRLEEITPEYNRLVRYISDSEHARFDREAEEYVNQKYKNF